jgi:hypothetical protein
VRPLIELDVGLPPAGIDEPIPSEVGEPPPPGDTTSGTAAETTTSETTTSAEAPAEPESTPLKSAMVEWSGVVQRATGRLDKGDECLLRLDVTPVDGERVVCTAFLTCADKVLMDGVGVDDCRLEETAAGDTWTYRTALWFDRTNRIEGALFGETGLFHGTLLDESGNEMESWRLTFSKTSLPRTGDALFETPRASKAKAIRGTAVATRGRTRAAKGQACTYTLGPNPSAGFLDDGGNRCQARIECGGHLLYDGAGGCHAAPGGEAYGYEDSSPSALDTDPRLAFDGKELTVADIDPTGPWRVTIYLDEDPAAAGER